MHPVPIGVAAQRSPVVLKQVVGIVLRLLYPSQNLIVHEVIAVQKPVLRQNPRLLVSVPVVQGIGQSRLDDRTHRLQVFTLAGHAKNVQQRRRHRFREVISHLIEVMHAEVFVIVNPTIEILFLVLFLIAELLESFDIGIQIITGQLKVASILCGGIRQERDVQEPRIIALRCVGDLADVFTAQEIGSPTMPVPVIP